MTPALAYIDPGAGALLLQWLIAGLLGSAFMLRRSIAALLARLPGRRRAPGDDPPSGQPPDGIPRP